MSLTYLDIVDPLRHSVFFPFDIHHAWGATASQEDEHIVERRRLLEFCDLLSGCDVVCSDQRVKRASHSSLKDGLTFSSLYLLTYTEYGSIRRSMQLRKALRTAADREWRRA